MTCNSSRIDLAARRLLSSVAATRYGRVSAMALAHKRGASKTLVDAGLLVQRGSAMTVLAGDDFDDAPTVAMAHPVSGRFGHLGNESWQDEGTAANRRLYALDMPTVARRVVARLDCSLRDDPVPCLDGMVLDFGMARVPRRNARVGIWVARGLTVPQGFERFRDLAMRRPPEGLRVVVSLDQQERHRFPFLRGHEFVALADVVDHEDGLAVSPDVLAARMVKGSSQDGPLWVSGDGGVLIVHGRQHTFTGGKQKVAVAMLAEAWLQGNLVLPVAQILEEAECGPTVTRLSKLFSGHSTWDEVIRESGSNCWLEV